MRILLPAAVAGWGLASAVLAAQAPVAAIPGVVAEGSRLERVVATQEGMDGIVGVSDGSVLYAQEHTSTVHRVDADGRDTVSVTGAHGAGSLGMDSRGQIYAVQRTCTDPGLKLATPCAEPPMVGIVAPHQATLADRLPDGRPLPRPADLVVDNRGGAFVAMSGVYHVGPGQPVAAIADGDIRANGIALSPDGRTLYVTNTNEIVAIDVAADGSGSNRRVFAPLGEGAADGLAVDAAGRLYACAAAGVHVLSPDGKPLGVIPTARRPTSLAFGGKDRSLLYVVLVGAEAADGGVGEGAAPNGGRTHYKLPMLARGFAGRPK